MVPSVAAPGLHPSLVVWVHQIGCSSELMSQSSWKQSYYVEVLLASLAGEAQRSPHTHPAFLCLGNRTTPGLFLTIPCLRQVNSFPQARGSGGFGELSMPSSVKFQLCLCSGAGVLCLLWVLVGVSWAPCAMLLFQKWESNG